MEIYKFGGASLSTAASVRAMGKILETIGTSRPLVVVVSAMGKVTNQLELLLQAAMGGQGWPEAAMQALREFHMAMAHELLGRGDEGLLRTAALLESLERTLRALPHEDYDMSYDRVVPYGELLSSTIVAAYLKTLLPAVEWVDIRGSLRTNNEHRNALVDEALSSGMVQQTFSRGEGTLYVTQGFLASTAQGTTTTLGREGSDYTAARRDAKGGRGDDMEGCGRIPFGRSEAIPAGCVSATPALPRGARNVVQRGQGCASEGGKANAECGYSAVRAVIRNPGSFGHSNWGWGRGIGAAA